MAQTASGATDGLLPPGAEKHSSAYLMRRARRRGYTAGDLTPREVLNQMCGAGLTWLDYYSDIDLAVRLRRLLLRAAGVRPGWRVLDVGFGLGHSTLAAALLVGPRGSVVALDADPDVLAWSYLSRARTHCGLDDRIALLPGIDIRQASFAPDQFDAAVFCFSGNHLGRANLLPAAVSLCRRWSKRVVIIDHLPVAESPGEAVLLDVIELRNRVFDLAPRARLSRVCYRSSEELAAILAQGGFGVSISRTFRHPPADVTGWDAAVTLLDGAAESLQELADKRVAGLLQRECTVLRERARANPGRLRHITVLTGMVAVDGLPAMPEGEPQT